MYREVDLKAGSAESPRNPAAQGSVKKEISKIHEESHESYGTPKIAEGSRKKGHMISEKTVGNYMHEMHT